MRFGLGPIKYHMKYKISLGIVAAVFVACGFYSCKQRDQPAENNITISTGGQSSGYKTVRPGKCPGALSIRH